MTLEHAIFYLRRYHRWRQGEGQRDFAEAGFTVGEVSEALSLVLDSQMRQEVEIRRLKAQLARCQVQRQRAHAGLMKQRKQEAGSRSQEEP
jgi:hypothetical protein